MLDSTRMPYASFECFNSSLHAAPLNEFIYSLNFFGLFSFIRSGDIFSKQKILYLTENRARNIDTLYMYRYQIDAEYIHVYIHDLHYTARFITNRWPRYYIARRGREREKNKE